MLCHKSRQLKSIRFLFIPSVSLPTPPLFNLFFSYILNSCAHMRLWTFLVFSYQTMKWKEKASSYNMKSRLYVVILLLPLKTEGYFYLPAVFGLWVCLSENGFTGRDWYCLKYTAAAILQCNITETSGENM